MPTYEFICNECNTRFEAQLHFNESPSHIQCPNGHRNTRRIFSTPNIVFKGNGFYVTDHRKQASPANK